MYIKDGSRIDYFHVSGNSEQYGYPKFKNVFSWGWIEDEIDAEIETFEIKMKKKIFSFNIGPWNVSAWKYWEWEILSQYNMYHLGYITVAKY